jgi:protein-S-isoprenylcysteine O-methyltransferase Ste14
MSSELLTINRLVVFASGLVYWAGVWVQARRVRHRIGRSANVRPKGAKEKILWGGWFAVVAVWLIQPFLGLGGNAGFLLHLNSTFMGVPFQAAGVFLVVAGYLGTLWCYAAMGDTWRMGINRKEKNTLVRSGPYRLVRHPIYGLQVVMLAGVALLLPSLLSLLVLAVHLSCVWVKALDEEAYLLTVHGQDYRDYLTQTGRLFPKLSR